MGIEELRVFIGEWELEVGLPGAEGVRGHVVFEALGDVLVQRISVPVPGAPDSLSVVVTGADGSYVQHYFDTRGVARLYAMSFDGTLWILQRSTPDFSPLDFHQRYVGGFNDDRTTLDGEWQTSDDGRAWRQDFPQTLRRLRTAR
jgi:hypothetical protein